MTSIIWTTLSTLSFTNISINLNINQWGASPTQNNTAMRTYDVYFNDDNASNNKGWHESKEYCIDYIKSNNGTNNSYFADYKGGVVSVYCNETEEEVYSEEIR